MTLEPDHTPATSRLRRGLVLRVREDACEVAADGARRWCGYAPPLPGPHTERISPGHLVALATNADGDPVVVWRWYDAVVVHAEGDEVVLWEPAHGEVSARRRPGSASVPSGSRAYLSRGLPGAEWWVVGPAVPVPSDADVELDEVDRLYTEHDLWDDLR